LNSGWNADVTLNQHVIYLHGLYKHFLHPEFSRITSMFYVLARHSRPENAKLDTGQQKIRTKPVKEKKDLIFNNVK
jgi:hypothetical protein